MSMKPGDPKVGAVIAHAPIHLVAGDSITYHSTLSEDKGNILSGGVSGKRVLTEDLYLGTYTATHSVIATIKNEITGPGSFNVTTEFKKK